jgi:hypothetical protein
MAYCLEIWLMFSDPAFQIQVFIKTLKPEIQREFNRAKTQPQIIIKAGEMLNYFEAVLYQEYKQEKQNTSNFPNKNNSHGGNSSSILDKC